MIYPRNPRNSQNQAEALALMFGTPTQDVLDALGKPDAICARDSEPPILRTSEPTGGSDFGTSAGAHGTAGGAGSESESDEDGVGDYFWNYFDLGIDLLFSGTQHALKKIIMHANAVGHWEFTQYIKCEFIIESRGLSVDSKWNEIQKAMRLTEDAPTPRPVVHNRGGHQNPFGPTCFYGYPGIIFEVRVKSLASNLLHQV
ncbi:hypothetical protein HDU86_001379 [Geranomyces michiganensis]|nr:hypothetical protein HDU86_001379 [Geranomyces michiganensis]